ncbi:MAG: type II secretion system F family protein [Verrucomicrobiaceae bacterium]|nr:MAG: type II secretion system F family protein [Verrucomicrobiaceae bacterium]
MPTFAYKALRVDGTQTSGELDASDRHGAMDLLDRGGLQPLNLDLKADKSKDGESKDAKSKSKEDELEITGPMRLKKAEIVLFTEELSELLGAGLQLEPALRVMENREELGKLKRLTKTLRQEVRDGTSFSAALAKASPSFGDLYCSLARAGEVSGALSTILKRQATYLIAIQELQSRVMMALIYPFFLIASGIAVVVLFITFLIPQLMGLLDNTNSDMPAIGQFMIDLSDFVTTWWWIILGAVIGTIFAFISYIKNPNNHEWWDETKLKIPLFGKVLKTRFFVQFLETLANLVGNGLTLLKALELSREATPNLYLKKIISKIIDYVGDGAALSRTMKRVGFFPPLLLDMVAVGEQTGQIGESLERAAGRYDRELGKDIAKISALIQPVIVVTMALLVGIMAYMMISVIFETISGLNT